MGTSQADKQTTAVKSEITVVNVNPGVQLRFYVADRPSPSGRMAAELTLDVSISLAVSLKKVWPVFADFNLWQSRFGYVWHGTPETHEDGFIYLSNSPGANDLNYALDGARTTYVVRKVIPEQLIYLDSLPEPMDGKDGLWTGHNVMSLHEQAGKTQITVFMEHTWYSETMSLEELRSEAKAVLDSGVAFWSEYFIPDLIAAVEANNSK